MFERMQILLTPGFDEAAFSFQSYVLFVLSLLKGSPQWIVEGLVIVRWDQDGSEEKLPLFQHPLLRCLRPGGRNGMCDSGAFIIHSESSIILEACASSQPYS
jgi:hypothetical protein